MAVRTKRQQGRGKKNRKYGRWLRKPSYQRYLAEKRWLVNKARRIARYKRKFPNWNPGNLPDEIRLLLSKLGSPLG